MGSGHFRNLVAVQWIFHFGAQSVARAETNRLQTKKVPLPAEGLATIEAKIHFSKIFRHPFLRCSPWVRSKICS